MKWMKIQDIFIKEIVLDDNYLIQCYKCLMTKEELFSLTSMNKPIYRCTLFKNKEKVSATYYQVTCKNKYSYDCYVGDNMHITISLKENSIQKTKY